MRKNEPNPKQRVMSLLTDYKKFLQQRKIENLIEDNPKDATGYFCSLLRPMRLRKKIESELALHKTVLQKDWQNFLSLRHRKGCSMRGVCVNT